MLKKAIPQWLDKQAYPFQHRYFSLPMGAMHYIDEGEGHPVVFLHGNESWSFEFRHVIKMLSKTCRCIVPDLIGFGLSDKPVDWDYLPQSHAQNLATFLDSLNTEKCTFVLSDWGGPIGLSYALKHLKKVQKIVWLNTCGQPSYTRSFYAYKSPSIVTKIGQLFNRYIPFFSRLTIQRSIGSSLVLSEPVYHRYGKPLAGRNHQNASAILRSPLAGSSAWLHTLWNQLQKNPSFPITFICGMEDNILQEEVLYYWQHAMPQAKLIWLEKAGHLPQEATPQVILEELGWDKKILKIKLLPGGTWREK